MESISAAQANRNFSHLLRQVSTGCSYVVTNHGRAVAKLIPVDPRTEVSSSAKETLLERLKHQPLIKSVPWNRDELYEDA